MRPDTAVTASWSCHLQWWRASAEGPTPECRRGGSATHTYPREVRAQAARHLGFPCIGAPPVASLCFGASSADHFPVGTLWCSGEERKFKAMLPGLAKQKGGSEGDLQEPRAAQT